MARLVGQFVIVVSLVVFLCEKTSQHCWRPVDLPGDPQDEYYQTFQNVPSPNVTAIKLINDFINKGYIVNFIASVEASVSRRYIRHYSCVHDEDVVIVMDASGSIGSYEFEKGKKALKYMLKLINSRLLENGKYAAVTFSSSTTVNFKFLNSSSASEKIMQVSYPGGGTNTRAALDTAKRLFDDTSAGAK